MYAGCYCPVIVVYIEMFRLLKSFMPILRSAKQHDVLGFGSTYGGFRGAVGLISEINHL